MQLLTVVLALVVLGVVLWLVYKYIPMDADVKQIIKIVVIVAAVLWLLDVFGLLDALKAIQIP